MPAALALLRPLALCFACRCVPAPHPGHWQPWRLAAPLRPPSPTRAARSALHRVRGWRRGVVPRPLRPALALVTQSVQPRAAPAAFPLQPARCTFPLAALRPALRPLLGFPALPPPRGVAPDVTFCAGELPAALDGPRGDAGGEQQRRQVARSRGAPRTLLCASALITPCTRQKRRGGRRRGRARRMQRRENMYVLTSVRSPPAGGAPGAGGADATAGAGSPASCPGPRSGFTPARDQTFHSFKL